MLFEQIQRNKWKTWLLLAGYFGLIAGVGAVIGLWFFNSAQAGMAVIGLGGLIYALIMVTQSTNVVMSMNNATEVTEQQQPELWHIVQDMAMVAQVPMPRVFIIDDDSPNAFATGNSPQNAAVAATTGILQRLNRAELEGVMAHEMTHVRNYDVRLATIALALSSVVVFAAQLVQNNLWWGGMTRRDDERRDSNGLAIILAVVVALVAPLLATIVQYAISRNREYLADAGAVELTRNPQGLISALRKIANSEPMQNVDENSAALYIGDPIKRERAGLFDTHPPMSERIKRLEEM
ncbi:MAG TPA: zinc metalloprotease HtpX [Lactobacillaceae bacterium]|jgi:heat shock protein HtpX